MNVLGRIFLKPRKEGRKDVKTEFFVRSRRTYVLNNRKINYKPVFNRIKLKLNVD